MSQFPHDEFIKEYIPELIQDYGETNSGFDVNAERREVDVFFRPTKQVPTTPETLGLLGRLAQTTCLFEVFRNSVESDQIMECLSKLTDIRGAIKREKKKNKEELLAEERAFLWILTPTLGTEKLKSFNVEIRENWPSGLYFLGAAFNTAIVVIHQLPVTKETLWLRLLGKGKVQEKAIDEVKSLTKYHPHRDNVLELVGNLFAILEANKKQGQKLAQEDKELIMKLSPIYVERLAEREQIGLEKGIQQGFQQALQQEATLIIRQIKRKIGQLPVNLETRITNLPLKTLEDLGEALLDFNVLDDLINWLDQV